MRKVRFALVFVFPFLGLSAQRKAPPADGVRTKNLMSQSFYWKNELLYDASDSGLFTGTAYRFYGDTGDVHYEHLFRRGECITEYRYYTNGVLMQEFHYKYEGETHDRVEHRVQKQWYENGQLREREKYRKAVPHGWRREYDQNGKWTNKSFTLVLRKWEEYSGKEWIAFGTSRRMLRYGDGTRREFQKQRPGLYHNFQKKGRKRSNNKCIDYNADGSRRLKVKHGGREDRKRIFYDNGKFRSKDLNLELRKNYLNYHRERHQWPSIKKLGYMNRWP